jgi:hypothetical protein
MLACTECIYDGSQPDCYIPFGDMECAGFCDVFRLPPDEPQEEPEQYEIKSRKENESWKL